MLSPKQYHELLAYIHGDLEDDIQARKEYKKQLLDFAKKNKPGSTAASDESGGPLPPPPKDPLPPPPIG